MIELFDASRLQTQRDRSVWAAALGLGLVALALLSWAHLRQEKLQRLQAEIQEVQLQLSKAPAPQNPDTLLQDLQRQAEGYENEATRDGLGAGSTALGGLYALRASQWLHRLGALAQPDIVLHKVAVERSGAVRIEGLALSPKALSTFVQAWERHDEGMSVPARGIDIKHEPAPAQGLRFWLRADPQAAPRS